MDVVVEMNGRSSGLAGYSVDIKEIENTVWRVSLTPELD